MAELSATIVHLSDLHFGAPFDLALWEILLNAIPPLRPDAVVVTGDLADNPRPRHFRKASNYLESLRDACEQIARQSCQSCLGMPAKTQIASSSPVGQQGHDAQNDVKGPEDAAGPTAPPTHNHRPKLFVIPGNHDYRVLGNIRLGWVSRWIFDVYFDNPDAPVGYIGVRRRVRRYFQLLGKHLRGWWRVNRRTKPDLARTPALTAFVLPGSAAAFFLYDSNRVPFLGALATGRVDPRQIAQTDFVVRNLLDKGLPTRAYRIGLVHHHPVPIPYADKTSLTDREGFLVLHNAGTFMREMIKSDFDLILHGHKHYSNFTRVSYQLTPLDRGEIGVVATGTATVRRGNAEGRNAFNVIRIYQNERAEIEQFEFGSARSVQYAQHAPYPFELYTARGLKDRAFRRALDLQKFSTRELTVNFEVSPEGDVKVTHDLRGMAVQRGRTKTYWPVSLGTPCGLVRKPSIELLSERAGLTWEPVSEPPHGDLSMEDTLERMQNVYGRIVFHRTVGGLDPPMDFGYSHFIVNALARDAQEFTLIQPPPQGSLSPEEAPEAPTESLEYAVVYPIERLRLRVHLPTGLRAEPYVEVGYLPTLIACGADDEGNLKPRAEGRRILDPNWTKSESRNLQQESATTWVLEVERPPVGCQYGLKWQVPEIPSQYVPAHIVEEARAYRELLLRYRERRQAREGRDDAAASEVVKLLRQFSEFLAHEFTCPDPKERLHIQLMTYDEHSRRLLVVDGLENGAELPERHWEFWLRPGLGNAGTCFKRGQSMVYLRDQTTIEKDYYVPWGTEYGVLVSTPVDHPELERHVRGPIWQVAPELPRQIVAVVNIGSTCTASTLRRLKDKAERPTLDAVESAAAFVIKAILQLLASAPLTQPTNDGKVRNGKEEKGEKNRQSER